MMLALGTYFFSWLTASYQNKTEARNYRWEAQNVIGQFPLYQYMGPGEQDLKLDGIIYSNYRGGILQLPLMKETASKGEPLMLVDEPCSLIDFYNFGPLRCRAFKGRKVKCEHSYGLGNVLGKWVITHLEEKQTTFCSNGLPRKVEFSLELKKVENRRSHILLELLK